MCKKERYDYIKGAPTINEFIKKFKGQAEIIDYLIPYIYPEGKFVCVFCGSTECVYPHKKKDKRLIFCQHCGRMTPLFAGTMFECTCIPLKDWFYIIYLLFVARKSTPTIQLARELGRDFSNLQDIRRKIQAAMGNYDLQPFSGVVEMDEVYLGGSNHGRFNKLAMTNGVKKEKRTYPVFGIYNEETKQVYSYPATKNEKGQYLSKDQIKAFISATCEPGSTIVSDEWKSYKYLDKSDSGYHHETVDHKLAERTNSNGYTTNGIEGYWSLIKKAYYSVHHNVSSDWVHLYLTESDFRYNHKTWDVALDAILKQSVFVPRVIDIRKMGKFGNRTYFLKDYRMILPASFDEIPLEQITPSDIITCEEPVYGILRQPYLSRRQRHMKQYYYAEEWATVGLCKGGVGYKDYRNNIVNTPKDIEAMIKDAKKHSEVNTPQHRISRFKNNTKRRYTMKRRFYALPITIQKQLKQEFPQILQTVDVEARKPIFERMHELEASYAEYASKINIEYESPYAESNARSRIKTLHNRYNNLPQDIKEMISLKYPNLLEVSAVEDTSAIHKELNRLLGVHINWRYKKCG